MRYKEIANRLKEKNSKAILIDGFDEALSGITQNKEPFVGVYDLEKCIALLVESGMTLQESTGYLDSKMQEYKSENDPVFVSL